MKKLLILGALVLGSATLAFAGGQSEGTRGPRGSMMEEGVQVTHEVKTLTGQLVYADKILPVFVSGGVEYQIMGPLHLLADLKVKNGETATAEGLVITTKTKDGKVENLFNPRKGKIGTVEFDLEKDRESYRGRGMGPGQGQGPRDDNRRGPPEDRAPGMGRR